MANDKQSRGSAVDKKALVLEAAQNRKSLTFFMVAGLALVALVVGGFIYWQAQRPWEADRQVSLAEAVQPKQKADSPQEAGDYLTQSTTAFQPGVSRHFSMKTVDGRTIRYFVVKGVDGKFRAALDACEVCYPANLGYAQQGQDMVCRNCGRHFPIQEVGLIHGGCNPVPLKFREDGDRILVGKADLTAGQKYFPATQ